MILNGCQYPLRLATGIFVPCGKCITCRKHRSNVWATRIQIEIEATDDVSFVTGTYAPEHLPETPKQHKHNIQLFQKRLRDNFFRATGKRLRFFSTSELGHQTNRPHAHSIIFNFPTCLTGATNKTCKCKWCSMLRDAWSYGFTTLRPAKDLTRPGKVAEYVSAYLLSHYEAKKGPDRERKKAWSFPLMSRRPAIGTPIIDQLAKTYLQYPQRLQRDGDVVAAIKRGQHQNIYGDKIQIIKPIGRTLRRNLRAAVGMPKEAPPRTLALVNQQFAAAQAAAEQCTSPQYKKHHTQLIIDAIKAENKPYADKLRANQFTSKRHKKL